MAWMSAADTANAFKSKACITFENLAPGQALFWTARVEDVLNQEGYVWNPWNLPVTSQRCHGSTSSGRGNAQSVCLQRRSWGFGAVLELYESPDCTHRGQRTRQIFNSAQCTPLTMTDFQSFQMIEPRSDQFDMHFSSTYYAIGASGYHACDIRPDTKIRIVPGRCEKMAGKGIYVGVYGVDDRAPPQGPAPGDKVLLRGTLPIAGHRRRRRHSRLGHHGHV
ncbi:hypothetical protein BCV70DRAFT_197230 [Testicularia cyperi]|uniref:Uncharacterized protein n=1 Tax=Testicularia cyperi TaxID=1882483 RepID=A0A317XYY3_9BASI|nr:hypothetical protein BCV70DRAFT_197230 [Testicularia cyperi]